MKNIYCFFVLLIFTNILNAQVAVIANKSVKTDKISATELLDFYTGEVRFWDNNDPVVVFDLEPKKEIKKTFYKYLGKSTSRMKSIWMKRMLSGEGDPPEAIESEEEMLNRVAKTKGSIGFINYDKVSNEVKVIALIDKNND